MTAVSPQPPSAGAAPRGGGAIALVVAGALVALIAVALLVGGAGLLGAHLFLRDADGWYSSRTHAVHSSGWAVTGEDLHIGDLRAGPGDWVVDAIDGQVRIRAAADGGGAVFVGIAREADVARFLAASAHDVVDDVEHGTVTYDHRPGERPPGAPAAAGLWVASASGAGTQTVTWDVRSGRWAAVVMNADGRRGVSAAVSVAGRTDLPLQIAIGLLIAGVALAALAAALLAAGLRRGGGGAGPGAPVAAAATGPAPAHAAAGPERVEVPATYPVAVDGRLDEPLGRWLWLVKWLLALPHYVVLAFLWTAYAVLTVVAFFGILFTGRYPRSLFAFNLGVLRWTWRVGFYAYSALGTDRYPPFSLGEEPDYPARLDVPYPEHLSRGLVLVKWWLLAIPHYVVVAILAGSWSWPQLWWPWAGSSPLRDGPIAAGSPGLIGVLVLVAGVLLAVGRRYPRELFDLVVGFNRWVLRVIAYATLMRDEYPPFSLRR